MNEEIDEYDIYHQDFTTVSDWEVFIARIEEVLNEWRLSKVKVKLKGEQTNKWTRKSEEISFRGLLFILTYHTRDISQNSGCVQNFETGNRNPSALIHSRMWEATAKKFLDDFDGSPYPVSNWFGLNQYLMLVPNNPLLEESQIRLIMSSVNIAFSNVDCSIPFFVKIREHWQQCYLGIYEDSEFKINFDTIHLKRITSQCLHLNGLTNLFKGKIGSPTPLEPIQMSAKFSYELKDMDAFIWKRQHTNEFLSIDGFDVQKLIELPFGANKNPIKSALLNVIWPRFVENAVIDSDTYSDFDPLMAPTWNITLKLRDDFKCLLADTVHKMMDLLGNTNLLMDTLGLSRSLGIVNPLHKITEAPITISKLVKAAMGSKSTSEFKGPISDELLMPLLYYLFPDAVNDNTFNYPENMEVEFKQVDNGTCKLCSFIKSSPCNGLVWRVSSAAASLLTAGGLPYLAHFWYEFTQELQYRWEHRIIVPGVVDGEPNARTCLLHQKLQLLNCCIKRAKDDGGTSIAGQSSDEEFYDCTDDEEEDHPPCDRPVGRLSRLEDATLKNGAPLYIPRTQDPPPKTEDQLEEDAELMVRLGDDARASELRARMMSASLLSDMEAFKAANPGAELCDFVQWYSPRDWKPDDGGTLGDRMLLPGNPWAEAWSVARPVPASRQRRLFDKTREAEQVLHYLRSRTVAGLAELLLPALLRAGAVKAMAEGVQATSSSVGGCDLRRSFEIAARELFDAEREVCRQKCVKNVLGDSEEGAALDANGRARILRVAGGALPPPSSREFSMRVRDAHAPQMMRAVLSTDIMIVGAFTERTVLM